MTYRQLVRDLAPLEFQKGPVRGTFEETSQAEFIDLLWEKLEGHMEAFTRQRGKYPLMLDQGAEMLAVLVEIFKTYPPQEDPLADLITIMRAKELIHGGYSTATVWTTED